jgi:hypothetical protein
MKAMCTYQYNNHKLRGLKHRCIGVLKYRSYALLMVILWFCIALILLSNWIDDFTVELESKSLQTNNQQFNVIRDNNTMLTSSASFIEVDKAQQIQAQLSALKMHNAMRFVPTHRTTTVDKTALTQKRSDVNSTSSSQQIHTQHEDATGAHNNMPVSITHSAINRDIEEKIAQWEARFQSEIKTSSTTAG